MEDNKKGFIILSVIIIIMLLVIGGVTYYYQNDNNINSVPQVQNDVETSHLLAFEDAINSNNWTEVQKNFSNDVYFVLEGSSCCGKTSVKEVVESLEGNLNGLKFTFDKESSVVKEYLDFQKGEYPDGRVFGNGVNFSDLIFGVEDNVNQQNKATIGYKVDNGKINVVFVNPGRDKRGTTQSINSNNSVDVIFSVSVSDNVLTVVHNDKVTQTFTADKFALDVVPSNKVSAFIIDKDINFDGHNDIAVLSSTGYAGMNYFYDFYFYNPTLEKFEKDLVLSEVSNPTIDIANKKILSTMRSGPQWYELVYMWNGSKYIRSSVESQ